MYWIYMGKSFRMLLQTSLRQKKQARQQQTCKAFSQNSYYKTTRSKTSAKHSAFSAEVGI